MAVSRRYAWSLRIKRRRIAYWNRETGLDTVRVLQHRRRMRRGH